MLYICIEVCKYIYTQKYVHIIYIYCSNPYQRISIGNLSVLLVSARSRQLVHLDEIPASPHDPPVGDLTMPNVQKNQPLAGTNCFTSDLLSHLDSWFMIWKSTKRCPAVFPQTTRSHSQTKRESDTAIGHGLAYILQTRIIVTWQGMADCYG